MQSVVDRNVVMQHMTVLKCHNPENKMTVRVVGGGRGGRREDQVLLTHHFPHSAKQSSSVRSD